MDKIWLKSYPPGVPAEIDPREYASVREVFEESCRKFATRPAFSCMGKTITFAELDTRLRPMQPRCDLDVDGLRLRGVGDRREEAPRMRGIL